MVVNTWATIRDGKIELAETLNLPEGTSVFVTLQVNEAGHFWDAASTPALAEVWDNAEDDVYAKLLEE